MTKYRIEPGTLKFNNIHDDGEGRLLDSEGNVVGYVDYTTGAYGYSRGVPDDGCRVTPSNPVLIAAEPLLRAACDAFMDDVEAANAKSLRDFPYFVGQAESDGRRPNKPEVGERLLQFFAYDHLPDHLALVSKPFCTLADFIVENIPRNPERTVALRKLLEVKDCAVRAVIEG